MLRILLLCALVLTQLSGCATFFNNNAQRLQTLPQHYDQFDAKLAWEIRTDKTSTVIDGVVKNIRYYQMNQLEIWVSTIDQRGKEQYRSVAFVNSLKENELGQFTVTLPAVAKGTKLQFLYRYVGHEGGGDSGNAGGWSQSFVSEVP